MSETYYTAGEEIVRMEEGEETSPLREAATVKARARGLLKQIRALLADRSLPKNVRDGLDGAAGAMTKTWADLEAEASSDANASESGRSFSELRLLLELALRAEAGNSDKLWLYVIEIWIDEVVYSINAGGENQRTMRRSYVIDASGNVTFGEAVVVIGTMVYMPIGEAADAVIEQEFTPLVERAVRDDQTMTIKIIKPGWGSSGYYAPEVLERDGPKVFTKGVKMFWDHPTPTEEAERPERSLRDLAAELVGDARWDAAGPGGPGLYAEAKALGQYKGAIEDLAPHIGVSIRALGRAKTGEAEGRRGPIIEGIVAAKSVDFVTVPGAGGQVLSLFEAARQPMGTDKRMDGEETMGDGDKGEETSPVQEAEVSEQEAQELREAGERMVAEIQRLQGVVAGFEARELARETLAGVELPQAARDRLIERAQPVVVDGKLDAEAFKAALTEAAKGEAAYIASIGGVGKVQGMGQGAPAGDAGKALEEAFLAMGLSESLAKSAAGGR